MALYFVGYDLDRNKDYGDLVSALENAGAKRLLYSEWALRTEAGVEQVFKYFRKFVEADDAILVTRVQDARGVRTMKPLKEI